MYRGIQRAQGKRVVDHGREFTLLVEVSSAAEIDGFADHSDVGAEQRRYRLNIWVDPASRFSTSTVWTWTGPTWKQSCKIPVEIGSSDYDGTLSVEVERVGRPDCGSGRPDPGTSHGRAVVGRAKVGLPKLGEEKGGRFGLVRACGGECKAEGFVFLNMKLVKRQKRGFDDGLIN
ncbi:unnamed protein product [Linum tenue]|uniref:Uncharacterized protein n=1 Tax=Linum tenue TaxID=586396 RepID=A0AAV0L085_9ROSI|nr:unnamed protein product [Linum tenue]